MLDQSFLTIENVIGPILLTSPLQENIIERMEKCTFEFFIPIEDITKALSNVKGYPLIGNNVYHYTSSLITICLHMGAVIPQHVTEGWLSFTGNSIFNTFDHNWNLTGQSKTDILPSRDHPFAGVSMIVTVTNEISNYIGTRCNEVKSKSSNKTPARGIAVVFISPVFEKPNPIYSDDCLEALLCTKLETESTDNSGWLIFGSKGDLLTPYNYLDFDDEDKPSNMWISERLKTQDLIIENINSRYILTRNGNMFSLFREAEEKELVVNIIRWYNLIWGKDSIKYEDTTIEKPLRYSWITKT
ncbi:hypothetical protein TVAG_242910 [Trichomonas vaginalis G3]|uniref:Uncharacterized protein n=1 Tax=Trichomonas vaginalis (strain ATCC PRA-98 / G3) TaxID=412133 RepID=A2F850_TRIV3|nr:hypothetical protein TVAGG3_0283020 [Trichomonas vaginalis G3]EAX98926.1 hypothetical protein TVAG_242910 [Trichomonas vaginalis G3]KAI5526697.1 hypothetical protein TVAGG3_0283020 [Trichomonas vaginalis G3]|eukprot:XP_001311856.1 hypothetical protein [Trichomonas vaginalis G3]